MPTRRGLCVSGVKKTTDHLPARLRLCTVHGVSWRGILMYFGFPGPVVNELVTSMFSAHMRECYKGPSDAFWIDKTRGLSKKVDQILFMSGH